MDDKERVRTGRHGGLTGWANTTIAGDRQQRMAAVRANSPANDDYWLRKLGYMPETMTPEERRDALPDAQTLKKQHFAELRQKSVAASKRVRADRLLKEIAAIDAEAVDK